MELGIILKNLINQFGHDFISESSKKILQDKKNYPFFDEHAAKIYNFLSKKDIYSHQNKFLSTFVHNIYYRNISKQYINTSNTNIKLRFNPIDAREYLKHTNKTYDVIFLDGFTPAKCPCVWSLELMQSLYTHTHDNSIIVTYNMSAPVRSALRQAGFLIGVTYDYDGKESGTIASKNESIICNRLSEAQEGLLNTRAGIPYRDESLSLENDIIILNRNKEVETSKLTSSSQYYKELKCKD